MKLVMTGPLGPMEYYRIGGQVHRVGNVFEVDDDRAKVILGHHPKSFRRATADDEKKAEAAAKAEAKA